MVSYWSQVKMTLTLWNNKQIKQNLNFKGVQNTNYLSIGKLIQLNNSYKENLGIL